MTRTNYSNSKILTLLLVLFFHSSLYPLHTIILKKNKTIRGTVKSQNTEQINYEDENGKKHSIAKSSVLKIIYRDIQAEEEMKIRQEEERKLEEEKKKLTEQHNKEQKRLKEELLASQKLIEPQDSSLLTSFNLGSPNPKSSIQLASYDASCQPQTEFTQYYLLFGSFPINELKLNELLDNDTKSVRINMQTTYLDLAFTIFLGFFTTTTRKTIFIESCETKGLQIYSESEINYIKENAIQQAKSSLELKLKEDKLELDRVNSDLKEIE